MKLSKNKINRLLKSQNQTKKKQIKKKKVKRENNLLSKKKNQKYYNLRFRSLKNKKYLERKEKNINKNSFLTKEQEKELFNLVKDNQKKANILIKKFDKQKKNNNTIFMKILFLHKDLKNLENIIKKDSVLNKKFKHLFHNKFSKTIDNFINMHNNQNTSKKKGGGKPGEQDADPTPAPIGQGFLAPAAAQEAAAAGKLKAAAAAAAEKLKAEAGLGEAADAAGLGEAADAAGLEEAADAAKVPKPEPEPEPEPEAGQGEAADAAGLGEAADAAGQGEAADAAGLGEAADAAAVPKPEPEPEPEPEEPEEAEAGQKPKTPSEKGAGEDAAVQKPKLSPEKPADEAADAAGQGDAAGQREAGKDAAGEAADVAADVPAKKPVVSLPAEALKAPEAADKVEAAAEVAPPQAVLTPLQGDNPTVLVDQNKKKRLQKLQEFQLNDKIWNDKIKFTPDDSEKKEKLIRYLMEKGYHPYIPLSKFDLAIITEDIARIDDTLISKSNIIDLIENQDSYFSSKFSEPRVTLPENPIDNTQALTQVSKATLNIIVSKRDDGTPSMTFQNSEGLGSDEITYLESILGNKGVGQQEIEEIMRKFKEKFRSSSLNKHSHSQSLTEKKSGEQTAETPEEKELKQQKIKAEIAEVRAKQSERNLEITKNEMKQAELKEKTDQRKQARENAQSESDLISKLNQKINTQGYLDLNKDNLQKKIDKINEDLEELKTLNPASVEDVQSQTQENKKLIEEYIDVNPGIKNLKKTVDAAKPSLFASKKDNPKKKQDIEEAIQALEDKAKQVSNKEIKQQVEDEILKASERVEELQSRIAAEDVKVVDAAKKPITFGSLFGNKKEPADAKEGQAAEVQAAEGQAAEWPAAKEDLQLNEITLTPDPKAQERNSEAELRRAQVPVRAEAKVEQAPLDKGATFAAPGLNEPLGNLAVEKKEI